MPHLAHARFLQVCLLLLLRQRLLELAAVLVLLLLLLGLLPLLGPSILCPTALCRSCSAPR